jgi:magnesium chelatase family protein
VVKTNIPKTTCFIGALSLDGSILPFEGMLAAALVSRHIGCTLLYMPFNADLPEIKIEKIEIVYVSSLQEVLLHLSGHQIPTFYFPKIPIEKEIIYEKDFSHIIGQQVAKGAMEIAAAGDHHLFITGPPGCGKSMLAETFPSILPPLSNEAQLEKISIFQLAGLDYGGNNMPAFRSPHHSASSISIIGGGQNPKPGEISFAHHGVLFLDEMAEFSKKTLDMLRQPIEMGKVTISRVHSTVTYPASFLLIGAMNPCPCGYLGSNTHYCTCNPKQIQTYQNRISGPIRDRFDIFLRLQSVSIEKNSDSIIESSKEIRKRVIQAREIQYKRYGREICNGRVSYETLMKTNKLSEKVKQMIQQMIIKKKWSNRVQIKIIRIARTISDLRGEQQLSEGSLWEAFTLSRTQDEYLMEKRKSGIRET